MLIKLNVIGKQVKKMRTESNLTLEDLSKKLKDLDIELSPMQINSIEKYRRKVKDYEWFGIAKVFGLNKPFDLLDSLAQEYNSKPKKEDEI